MSHFWFTCTWLLSRCGIFRKVISRVLELLGGTLNQEVARHLNKDLKHGAQEQIINHLRMISGCKENFLLPRGEEMIHLSRDNWIRKNHKWEEILLVELSLGRLVAVIIEKCLDHQAELGRGLKISVGGQSHLEKGVVWDAIVHHIWQTGAHTIPTIPEVGVRNAEACIALVPIKTI